MKVSHKESCVLMDQSVNILGLTWSRRQSTSVKDKRGRGVVADMICVLMLPFTLATIRATMRMVRVAEKCALGVPCAAGPICSADGEGGGEGGKLAESSTVEGERDTHTDKTWAGGSH